jgi:hypothetical protein
MPRHQLQQLQAIDAHPLHAQQQMQSQVAAAAPLRC